MGRMLFDAATAIGRGQRDYQEDAVVADFAIGADHGFAVLADGMGGHAAGDIASKIVVTEVFGELKLLLGEAERAERDIAGHLSKIAHSANECIGAHVETAREHRGMGATLVAPVIFESRLYWVSIGDSPLYLYRAGQFSQLNEDHSMAPQIDVMMANGLIDRETALNHPDRNCLTSVLMGTDIPRIDCKAEPTQLRPGDVVVAASDGLPFLPDGRIRAIVHRHRRRPADEIARALMEAVDGLEDPDQDNVSMAVVKLC